MLDTRRLLCLFFMLLFLFSSGCAERPFLSKESHYQIVVITSEEEINTWPIEMTWNSNLAVLQQLLLEASFVLGDLQTLSQDEDVVSPDSKSIISSEPEPLIEKEYHNYQAVLLEALFTEAKPFDLVIDQQKETIELTSVQIEIQGEHPGLVILNHELKYQGIINPNLELAFRDYLGMLAKENSPDQSSTFLKDENNYKN